MNIDTRYVEKKTPIFTTLIDGHDEMNQYVKYHILEMKKQHPEGVDESNVKAWRSDWFTHKITKVFDPLVDMMGSACDYIAENYYDYEYSEPDVKFKPFNFWVMDYVDGDKTLEHNHFPTDFSCVYYVDVEEGCAPLIIEGETIQPENGLLVVFPGHLNHIVPPNKGRRMCASGNFHLKPVDIYKPHHQEMSIEITPPEYLFPTKVLMSYDKNFNSYQDDMIKWMVSYSKNNKGVNKSNIGGYQSPDNFYQEESFAPYMERIMEQIFMTVDSYLDDELSLPKIDDMKLSNMWFNFNHPHCYNVLHNHPGCLLAGVFWVKVVEDTCIRFECLDSFGRAMLEQRTNEAFHPKEGGVCIFPSYLPHMVDQNNTKDTRISISFNISSG